MVKYQLVLLTIFIPRLSYLSRNVAYSGRCFEYIVTPALAYEDYNIYKYTTYQLLRLQG